MYTNIKINKYYRAKEEFSFTHLLVVNKLADVSTRNIGKFSSHKQVGKGEPPFCIMEPTERPTIQNTTVFLVHLFRSRTPVIFGLLSANTRKKSTYDVT